MLVDLGFYLCSTNLLSSLIGYRSEPLESWPSLPLEDARGRQRRPRLKRRRARAATQEEARATTREEVRVWEVLELQPARCVPPGR